MNKQMEDFGRKSDAVQFFEDVFHPKDHASLLRGITANIEQMQDLVKCSQKSSIGNDRRRMADAFAAFQRRDVQEKFGKKFTKFDPEVMKDTSAYLLKRLIKEEAKEKVIGKARKKRPYEIILEEQEKAALLNNHPANNHNNGKFRRGA